MPPRKRIPGGYSERDQRLLRWTTLTPAYRARLERAGIGPQSYADRLVPLARARGHGSKARENALRRVSRARARGLPVDSPDPEYGFHRADFDTVAETYGRKGSPDYDMAADLIIARAEAEAEYLGNYGGNRFAFRNSDYVSGPKGQRLKVLWLSQPPDAPDRWYWYH